MSADKNSNETGTGCSVFVKTLVDLASVFGVSYEAVKKWKKEGMPAREQRGYNIGATIRWWREQRDRHRSTRPADDETLKSETGKYELEKRKLAVDIKTKELQYEELVGRLVDRNAAKAAFSSLCHRIRARLEAIPEELASSVPPDLRTDYVRDAGNKVRLILKEMENWSKAREKESEREEV